MNFADFQLWRKGCLGANPNAIDCGETNLYRSLSLFQPKADALNVNRPVHRCDLARAWLGRYGFPESDARRALVCRGVRHALNLIFHEIGRVNAKLWVPRDVYPKYLELARAVGLEPKMFNTLPQPELPQGSNSDQTEYLLVANPWKPLGRFIIEEEFVVLMDWLNSSPSRYLLLDCVYDLSAPFHIATKKLIQTGKAILLHSVTKGWLWPETFGVALFGEFCPQMKSAFQNDSPSLEQLRLAEKLLIKDVNVPNLIIKALANRQQKLFAALPRNVFEALLLVPGSQAPGCYFFPIRIRTKELFLKHNIIAIAASAFGADWDGSIVTSLAGQFAENIS